MNQQIVQEIGVDKTHSSRGSRELRSDYSNRVNTYCTSYENGYNNIILYFSLPIRTSLFFPF